MKQQFKIVMLEHNTWASPLEIDKLFTHSAILTQEANKNFRRIRSSQVSDSLSKQFDSNMTLGSKSTKPSGVKNIESSNSDA